MEIAAILGEATVLAVTIRMFDKPLYCPTHGEVQERAFYFKNRDLPLCGYCVEKFLDDLKAMSETKPTGIKKFVKRMTRYDIAKGRK
jgi:hypothetical protein